MGSDGRGGRYRAALRSRDFRLLTTAFIINGLGGWAYLTVVVVYVFERSGSATWIALVTSASWIPRLVLAGYGGVIADRYDRVRVMVLSDLTSCLLAGGIAVVIATDGPLWILLALTAASGAATMPYSPATGALTPDVVPERDLAAANGLYAALDSAVVVVGPGVGAVLLALDEPTAGVVLNAVSFLLSALIVSRVSVRSVGEATEQGQSAYRSFMEGVSALRAEHVALVLVIFCALDSGVYGASTVLYVALSEQFGTGADGFGYLLAGMAVGGVISAGVADRLSRSRRLAPVIVGGIAVQAVPFGLSAFVDTPPLGFALQVISGSGMIIVDVLAITALQRSIKGGVLGRVMGLLDVAVLLSIVVSSYLFATLLRTTDLDTALAVLGVGFPAVALLGMRPLLRADRDTAARVKELEPRIRLLQVLDLFDTASQAVLEQVAGALEIVEQPPGVVVREGEPADALWIIVDGEMAVSVDGSFVRVLGPRSYFGEIGLLRGIPRTATVRATEPSVLWRLSAEDFQDAVQTSAASASLLRLASSRLARTNPRLAEESEPAVATPTG
jgi:MFS family permease